MMGSKERSFAPFTAETFPKNRLDALLRTIAGINHGRKRPLIGFMRNLADLIGGKIKG